MRAGCSSPRRRRKKQRAHFFISFVRTACKHGLKRKTSAPATNTHTWKEIDPHAFLLLFAD
jgi:hypothetical protein